MTKVELDELKRIFSYNTKVVNIMYLLHCAAAVKVSKIDDNGNIWCGNVSFHYETIRLNLFALVTRL